MESSFGDGLEQPGGNEALTTADDIIGVYERWSRRKSGDARINKISGALADALRTQAVLRDAADFMIAFHERPESFGAAAKDPRAAYRVPGSVRPLPFPEYGANLLMRGMWNEWRHIASEVGWPGQFISREICEKSIFRVIHDSELFDRFSQNIAFRSVQTTIPDRIIGAKLELEAHRGRFTDETGAPRPRNIVSIGHGLGFGEKKLLLNRGFEGINFHDFADFEESHLGLSPANSALLNDRLSRTITRDKVFCLDVMPGDDDPATRDWIIGSFTPDEQMNRRFMAEIEELDSKTPPGYVSLRGDFSSRAGVETLKSAMAGQGADLVLLSTVMYQSPEPERMIMLQHAAEILAPGGIIVMQDFVQARNIVNKKTGETTPRFSFPGDWKKWMYKSVLIDDPNKNGWYLQPRIYYKDGRAHDIYIPYRYRAELLGSDT